MNEKIDEFQKLKMELSKSKRIQLLYRGDSLNNVYSRFGVIDDNTEYNKNELLNRIFLIGDKSRYFYKEEVLKWSQYQRKINLTGSDDNILEVIFLQINTATQSNKDYLKKYFERNREIKHFFSDLDNKIKFVNGINATKNKFRYRNYYLTILHQLFYIEYRNNTHFVSTSLKFIVAKRFAGNNGIIIHCWQPIEKFKRLLLKKYNLPRQTSLAFEEQDETSLIGGILPHFIIGVEFLNENEFYFNSNITNNQIGLDTFMFGLNINQNSFLETIKKTSFRKLFTIAGKKIQENDVNR